MSPTEPFELDQRTRERIRSRALERGARLRRRTTVVRRSVTVVAVLALAGGGVAIAEAAHGVPNVDKKVPIGPSTTATTPYRTTTTSSLPPDTSTTVPAPTTTSVPGGGGGGGTTTTAPRSTTTSTSTVATTSTIPAGRSFSKTLTEVVPPGAVSSSSWTVPSGVSVEASTVTLSKTGASRTGDLRLELQSNSSPPVTLVEVDLQQVSTKSYTFTLATPEVVTGGLDLVLTVSCDANQGACPGSVTFAGKEVPVPRLQNAGYGNALDFVGAPGTTTTDAGWTTPAHDQFSLTDLLVSTIGQVRGTLRVAAGNRTVYEATLPQPGGPVYFQPAAAVQMQAGESLTITVVCGKDQPACQAAVMFTGRLSASS
jgi:hypothetical protein